MSSIFQDIKSSLFKDDVVMRIILINIIVYLIILLSSVFTLLLKLPDPIDFIVVNYLMLPSSLDEFILKPWSIFTYMFLHKSFFHILFNMLVLYWFGNILREYLGAKKVPYTYILGGVAGGLFYILCYNIFPYFTEAVLHSKALGASAGIMAIVFAAATLLPNYSIVLAIFGAIRLKYIAFVYLMLDLIGISSSNSGGHLAHIGGALFGFILIKQIQKGNDWIKIIDSLLDKIKSFFSKRKMKVVHKSTSQASSTIKTKPNISQQEIDRILDKISESGYEKLTALEKETLFKAGNH